MKAWLPPGSAILGPSLLVLGCSVITATDEVPVQTPIVNPDGGDNRLDAGTQDGAASPDAPRPCDGPDRCSEDAASLIRCEAGFEVAEPCPLGCLIEDEGVRCATMQPSNVGADLWTASASPIDLRSGVFALDTTACSWGVSPLRTTPQADGGPNVCVLQVSDFRIRSEAAIRVRGNRPFVVMATGAVRVEGAIDLHAEENNPGPGGERGGTVEAPMGQGAQGGGPGEGVAVMAEYGGGGGGGLCGSGGEGGQGGRAMGGASGPAIGEDWELRPLMGGSGGGASIGRAMPGGADVQVGLGGAGGGAIQISSQLLIELRGQILAGGGGGLGGGASMAASGGGGGGSGGAVLLEAPNIEVREDGGVLAAGGAGGGGSGRGITGAMGSPGTDGSQAGTGRASGGVGGAPQGPAGGNSGGGAAAAGLPGGSVLSAGGRGGGGGGAVGCLLFRTASGEAPDAGMLNPNGAPGVRALPLLRE